MNRSIISGSLFENRRGSAQSSFHWLRLQLCDEFSGIANVATKAPNRRRCPEFSFIWMRSSSRQLVRFARHGSHLPYYPIEWLFCSLSRSHHSRVIKQISSPIIPPIAPRRVNDYWHRRAARASDAPLQVQELI